MRAIVYLFFVPILAVGLQVSVGATTADAHPVKPRLHRHWNESAPISVDAVELGILAPPSPRSTFADDFGDAGIARRHFQAAERIARDGGQISKSKCFCRDSSSDIGGGQYYALTPAYVSSPQVVGVDPTQQSPLLSPITELFWAADGLRVDPRN